MGSSAPEGRWECCLDFDLGSEMGSGGVISIPGAGSAFPCWGGCWRSCPRALPAGKNSRNSGETRCGISQERYRAGTTSRRR